MKLVLNTMYLWDPRTKQNKKSSKLLIFLETIPYKRIEREGGGGVEGNIPFYGFCTEKWENRASEFWLMKTKQTQLENTVVSNEQNLIRG